MNAPVEWYIYNIGPSRQVINAGDMGTHYLLPPGEGERYNKPLRFASLWWSTPTRATTR